MGAVVAVVVYLVLAHRANDREQESLRLQLEGDRLEGLLVSAKVASVPVTKVETRLQLAAEAARRLQTSDAQGQLFAVLLAAPTPVDVQWAAATAGANVITSVVVSPNGQRLLFVAGHTLHALDLAARQVRFSTPLDDATSDDPFLMLAGTKVLVFDAGHAYLVDGDTGKKLGQPVDGPRAATVSADGTTAAFLVGDDLVLCDLQTDCATRQRHNVKRFAAVDLALSADGASVATLGERVTLLHTRPWRWRADARLDGASEVLAIGTSGGAIQICTAAELRTYAPNDQDYNNTLDTRLLRRFPSEATACVLSPTAVLTSHADDAVRVWNAEGQPQSLAAARVELPNRMTVSDQAIAVGGTELRIWDQTQFGRRRDSGKVLRFARRNGYVLGSTLQALDAGKNEPAPTLELEGHTLVAVSDSLELAAYVPREPSRSRRGDALPQVREIVLAELRPGLPPVVRWKATPPTSEGPSASRPNVSRSPAVISDDNRYVALQRDETVVVVNAIDSSEVRTLPGKSNVAFTPNPAEVLALDEQGIAVVSLADGIERPLPEWHQAQVRSLISTPRLTALPEHAFSRDGRLLAMADNRSEGSVVRVYRWPEMAEVAALVHQANVMHIAFRPDGQALVTSTAEATTHAWDLQKAREILRLPPLGATSGATAAVFTPSGQIAVLHAAGLSVLPSDPSVWEAEACQRIARNLTKEEWALAVGSEVEFNKTCTDKP